MFSRYFLISALVLTWSSNPLDSQEISPEDVVDQDYVLALGTANRFLCAWLSRDQEAGLKLLSSAVRTTYSEDDLRLYLAGLSNPHHAAFEVGVGRRLTPCRFAFPVRLYEHYSGEKWRKKLPVALQMVVVKTDEEEWRIGEVPGTISDSSR